MKNKYRILCDEEPTIPIFNQAWWLDSVAGDNWAVVLVEKGGRVQAALPYTLNKRLGLTMIIQPLLTQHLGPWLRANQGKMTRVLAREKDLLQALYKQLPSHSYYAQNWHYACANWLPLHWLGYEQTTRYTYRINQIDDFDVLWSGLDTNIRTDIRKATNKEQVEVKTDLSIDDFLSLNKKVFARQGMVLPYSEDLVRRIDSAARFRNAGKSFIAVDDKGRHHAGVYIVWDSNSAYYLLGGGDPDLRNSGATSLCMWEAIKYASTVTKSFDFEGSMIEPIERFFRAFGAVQTPYFSISKTNSKALKFYRCVRGLIR